VTDNPRNPVNAVLANGEAIGPVIVSRGEQHAFYYSVITNGMRPIKFEHKSDRLGNNSTFA